MAKPSMALNNLIAASSGGAGAAVSTVLLYPLEVVKTNMNKGVDSAGVKFAGPFDVVKRVLSNQGVPGLFRGVQVRTGHQICQKFLYYYTYDFLLRIFKGLQRKQKISFAANVLVGYIAGVIAVLISNPLEVLSTRQQLMSKPSSGQAPGLASTVLKMLQEEGISSFFRGAQANVILSINPAIENSMFDQVKMWFLRRAALKSLSAAQAFWIGAVAKIIATAVTFPYIRAKVIIQSRAKKVEPLKDEKDSSASSSRQESGTNGVSTNLSALKVFQEIVADDGFCALWKGMGPQALKAVLSSAVLLAAKEKIEAAVRLSILTVAGHH